MCVLQTDEEADGADFVHGIIGERNDMKSYRLTIKGWTGGLNEMLNGVRFDWKSKRVVNPIKHRYEKKILDALRFQATELKGVVLDKPIVIHYLFFCPDRRHDRMNVGSAFDKAFCDALQKGGYLKNDGWNDILGCSFDYGLSADNPRVEIVIEEADQVPVFWEKWKEYL